MEQCSTRAELAAEVESVLQEIVDLTTQQLDHFRAGTHTVMMDLDRKLENAIGKKERAIGALREHTREHKCG